MRFYYLLNQVGWRPGATNLRRVTAKDTRGILWVCPEHYPIYDRDLPVIPEQF